jgi:hypothetical protein
MSDTRLRLLEWHVVFWVVGCRELVGKCDLIILFSHWLGAVSRPCWRGRIIADAVLDDTAHESLFAWAGPNV